MEVEYLQRVAAIFGFDDIAFDRMRATFTGDASNDPYAVLGVTPDTDDATSGPRTCNWCARTIPIA